MILVGSAACLLVALGKVPDPAPRQPLAALSRDARPGDVLFAGADFYLPARLASERGDLGMQVHPFPAKVAEHPGWFAPHVPTDRDYHDLASARKHGGGRVFLLIPPSYRTPAVEAIPGWREMGRSRAGVLLVWEE